MDTIWRDHRQEARHRLSRMMAPSGSLNLIEAMLWIAAEEYPDLDVAHEAERLRLIAQGGAARVESETNPFARLEGLRSYMFDELGFCGNDEDYNDPANSYLNEVLDRRLGIPLTLSIVFIELARAAGFQARGIGLPGHFVTSVTWDGRTILLDPFHGGRVITEDDCRQLVERATGRPSLFRRELLEGTPEKAMLGRLLLNLKQVFLGSGDYTRALAVVERLLLVWPGDRTEVRDRGFLKAYLGRLPSAIEDLEICLELDPGAPDAKSVEGRLLWLRRKLAELN